MDPKYSTIMFESIYDRNTVAAFASIHGLDITIIERFYEYKQMLRQLPLIPINKDSISHICKELKFYSDGFRKILHKWENVPSSTSPDIANFVKTCKNLNEYCDQLILETARGNLTWI
jgi:hypothetical protein